MPALNSTDFYVYIRHNTSVDRACEQWLNRCFPCAIFNQNRDVEFPRSSENFSSSVPGRESPALRLVDQRNLLAETSALMSLFKSKKALRVKTQSVESRFQQLLNNNAK
jgi:hypothetical protein